jgi:hypothetical protein
MKHLTTIIAAAVALVLLLPAAGHCQEIRQKKSRYYAAFKAGAFFPDRGDYDNGFSGEVAIGGYLNPNLVLEGSLGFVSIDDFTGSVDTVFGPVPAEIDVTATPLTFTFKFLLPLRSTELYLGAGAGFYFMRVEATFYPLGWPSYIDENEVLLGGHLVAGLTVDVERRIFIGLEGKYTATESVDIRLANTPIDVEMNGIGLTVLAGFRF